MKVFSDCITSIEAGTIWKTLFRLPRGTTHIIVDNRRYCTDSTAIITYLYAASIKLAFGREPYLNSSQPFAILTSVHVPWFLELATPCADTLADLLAYSTIQPVIQVPKLKAMFTIFFLEDKCRGNRKIGKPDFLAANGD